MTNYWKDKKILLTGGAGFLGSYIVNNLVEKRGVPINNIVIPRKETFDLRILSNCKKLVADVDIVIHAAATVGGIGFNQKYPGTIFFDNIIMGVNLIEAARQAEVKKFVQIGTVCSYPKYVPLPFKEDNLWNGYPEETNAPYGIAKKSLIVMASAYQQQYGMNIISLLPVNLYGPGDSLNPELSHVIPSLIRKLVEAKENNAPEVVVWGTGNASREFLYIADAAEGIVLATEKYNNPDPVNLGSGKEVVIKELVNLVANLIGYNGKIVWDNSKPDGQPRRSLDVSRARIKFGFEAKTEFVEGLKKTIEWYEGLCF